MPIFGWGKKPSDSPKPDAGKSAPGGNGAEGLPPTGPAPDSGFSPEKAGSWFQRARGYLETGNTEYSMVSWLSGLRFDPTSVEGLTSFFQAAAAHSAAGAKGVSREVAGAIKGSTDVDKYLQALLAWSAEPTSADAAVRATVAAVGLGLHDAVKWIAPRALMVCAAGDKPRKDHLLKLMEIFHEAGDNEHAVQAGERALQLDPADNDLRADVRDLAAQASIDKGGYEQNVGEAGGYRSSVADLSKQRKLDESERIVKSDEAHARLIADDKAAYLARPSDRPTIVRYLKSLRDRGHPADLSEAIRVSERAYADTQEFRFRQLAGEVRLAQGRAALRELKANADSHPNDPIAPLKYKEAVARHLEVEIAEYRVRVAAYPTDLKLKFELGLRNLEAGHYEAAVEQLQLAKTEGPLKLKALYALGLAFHHLGWEEEAIETFRNAIASIQDLANDPMSKDLRYALLLALQAFAEKNRDVPAAEEAAKLAQGISMAQITYKDIRARRDAVKALLVQLRAGS